MSRELLAVLLLLGGGCDVSNAADSAGAVERRPIQRVGPVRSYNPEINRDEWVQPSRTTVLPAGKRLDVPYVTPSNAWIVQRLTQRSYWVMSDQFVVTVFVGNHGVLIIDMPDVFDVGAFRAQVALLSPLPITTVVYSHPHVDHVAATSELQELLRKDDIELRIIASANAAREIKRYKQSVPLPTQVIPNGHSSFEFEHWTFKYVTPVVWAHTGADSYIITPGGVLHIVDFFYPARLPMAEVSGVQNMTGWIDMCRHVAGDTDWNVANLGHANIGYREDVLRTLDYFDDLYTNAFDIFQGFRPEVFAQFVGQNTGVMIRSIFDGAAQQLADSLAAKWGHYPHWEVARDHAEKVMWDIVLNYDYKRRLKPGFSPIPPPAPERDAHP